MWTVETRTLGQRASSLPEFSVPPPEGPGADDTTLRQLIERVVRAQVTAYQERQEARRFVRFLSARESAEGAAKGKVDAGGREVAADVDEEEAVGTAIQGFEDGLYLVLIDDEEQKDLDRQVHLGPDSRLTFLRLTFLAGG